MKFYLVAMAFIVLDVEIIFLYPFTTVSGTSPRTGSLAMGVFLLVLLVPFAYLLSTGAARLGPVRQVVERVGAVSCAPPVRRAATGSTRRTPRRVRGGSRATTSRGGGLMGLEQVPHNFLTGRLEDLVKWARRNSVWPATFGLACCAIEMMAAGRRALRPARFGMEVFRASPARPTS